MKGEVPYIVLILINARLRVRASVKVYGVNLWKNYFHVFLVARVHASLKRVFKYADKDFVYQLY